MDLGRPIPSTEAGSHSDPVAVSEPAPVLVGAAAPSQPGTTSAHPPAATISSDPVRADAKIVPSQEPAVGIPPQHSVQAVDTTTPTPVQPVSQSHPVQPVTAAPAQPAVTSTIDPDKPSSESAPTALPTNPATHPKEQQDEIKHEHPAVVAREVEKTKAAERDLKGEKPKGTVVAGLEDDRLWQMLRRFDVVRRPLKTFVPHADVVANHSRLAPGYAPPAYRTRPATVHLAQPPFSL
jgi:hypothetical protein